MKIDHFSRFLIHNFPKEYAPNVTSVDKNIQGILYYIDSIADVSKFVKLCKSTDPEKDNRVVMVYEKVRKNGVNSDLIFMPFKNGEYSGFLMKAPMLC